MSLRHAAVRCAAAAALLALAPLAPPAAAQPVVERVFPPEEFAARRARLARSLGDGVAVLLGTTERPGEQPLRQGNQFYYLSGVVEPLAALVVEGRTGRTTLFLRPGDERRQTRAFGPELVPGDSAARATGVDRVLPRDSLAAVIAAAAAAGHPLYTPFRPEVLGSASAGDVVRLARTTEADPWDGRPSREAAFRARLAAAAPRAEVRDLDPLVDSLRAIKSPREIAVIREATRITGLAIEAAMREARPGIPEYALQAPAEYVFKRHGSYGAAYFALIATGRNTWYSHYHRNTATLRDGDLVQFDYAPDYHYYVSDVTRVFPANGRFTARQRELYTIYLQLYRAVIASIRPHVTPAVVVADAVRRMDAAMAAFRFTDPRIRAAAQAFVERYRASTPRALGHTIGMEVHDVPNVTPTLEPGQVFTIEPAIMLPDERLAMRLEDVLLITPTGVENLSAAVPVEIDAVEAMMAEPGLDARTATRAAVPGGGR